MLQWSCVLYTRDILLCCIGPVAANESSTVGSTVDEGDAQIQIGRMIPLLQVLHLIFNCYVMLCYARPMPSCGVCLSVSVSICSSVMFAYSVKTNKRILNTF